MTRYRAPALARGIEVLRVLEQAGALSLDALAKRVAAPKSSLLRILGTLAALRLVERDDARKTYRATAVILPMDRRAQHLRRAVAEALRRLAAKSGHTAEWYLPAQRGMVLVERAEPPDREVRVAARLGFVRPWHGELEAVSCLAAGRFPPKQGFGGWRTCGETGSMQRESAAQARQRIAAGLERGYVRDDPYNANGVRRMAAAVLKGETLIGILAIAENFRPDAERARPANLRALRGEAKKLCESECTLVKRQHSGASAGRGALD